MKELSCSIIEDLLPLYYDNVCSLESRNLVDEHIENCPKCRDTLKKIETEISTPLKIDEASSIKSIAKKWKMDKRTAFLRGASLISFLAGVMSFIIYNVKGSYVAPDGTLIESFGYIPIGFLFTFVAAFFGLILLVIKIKNHVHIKYKSKNGKTNKKQS